MKKQYLVSFVAMFIIAFVSFNTTLSAEVSVSHSVLSKYVDDTSANFLDKPVLQTEVSGEFGRGAYWSVFHSIGLDDSKMSSNYGDEIDLTVGWSKEMKGITFDTNLSYWDCHKLFSNEFGDVVVIEASFSKTFGGEIVKKNLNIDGSFTVSITHSFLKSTKIEEFEGGSQTALSISYSVTSKDEKRGGTLSYSVMRDDGTFGLEPAYVGKISLDYTFKVGKVEINLPKFVYTKPINRVEDGRRGEFVFGGGVSYSF